MPLVITTWDLPAEKEQLEKYAAWAGRSIKDTLAIPGTVEWRGFRNPLNTTPQVMAMQEFDTLQACYNWLQSDGCQATSAEIRSLGCTNLTVQVWDTSPLAPKPLRPAG